MIAPFQVRLRFSHAFENRKARRLPLHTHPFWQLECIRKGPVNLLQGKSERTLSSGDAILIPAGCGHGFRYPEELVEWSSCKFDVHGLENPRKILKLEQDAVLEQLLEAVRLLVGDPAEKNAKERLDAILTAVLIPVAESVQEPSGPGGRFLLRVEERVREARGNRLSIKELAGDLGYEPGYLAGRYRQLRGQSLKAFIDAERMARACDLLQYSMMSVSETAEVLGFPEVYSFSRFFKKQSGKAPSVWRRNVRRR